MVGRDSLLGYRSDEWLRLAVREKVMLIVPDGVKASDGKRAWNDCRADAPTNAASDDVAFISALIDIAIGQFNADPQRVYVFGASNGGAMAYRLEIRYQPAAGGIGVQSALMPAQNRCGKPSQPVSVFITHGTKDKIAPYSGGEVGAFGLHGRGSGSAPRSRLQPGGNWRDCRKRLRCIGFRIAIRPAPRDNPVRLGRRPRWCASRVSADRWRRTYRRNDYG